MNVKQQQQDTTFGFIWGLADNGTPINAVNCLAATGSVFEPHNNEWNPNRRSNKEWDAQRRWDKKLSVCVDVGSLIVSGVDIGNRGYPITNYVTTFSAIENRFISDVYKKTDNNK